MSHPAPDQRPDPRARHELIRRARALAADGDLDAAILLALDLGERSAADLRGLLGLELTETRRVAGRLRSLEHRGLVKGFFNAFVETTSWRKLAE